MDISLIGGLVSFQICPAEFPRIWVAHRGPGGGCPDPRQHVLGAAGREAALPDSCLHRAAADCRGGDKLYEVGKLVNT